MTGCADGCSVTIAGVTIAAKGAAWSAAKGWHEHADDDIDPICGDCNGTGLVPGFTGDYVPCATCQPLDYTKPPKGRLVDYGGTGPYHVCEEGPEMQGTMTFCLVCHTRMT